MKKRLSFIKLMLWSAIGIFILNGCSGKYVEEGKETLENEAAIGQETERVWTSEAADADEEEGNAGRETLRQGMEAEESEHGTEGVQSADEAGSTVGGEEKPEIVEADWAEYFDGFQGAAVVYDVSALRFMVYNSELAQTRRSPCSTFKIISSLAALEHGVIDPADSVRQWSGEVFWNEKWNKDMDFGEAFRDSCVWYFREVIERIFGEASSYSGQARDYLKEVMLVEEQSDAKLSVYGKTGMGKAEGIVADAWFAGFAQGEGDSLYFCVYLGRTDDKNATSTAAKEIAIRLVSDYGKANL
jgi:bla regulator protein BlaR1